MCGCTARKTGQAPLYTVKMPDGSIRAYSSPTAAKAKVANVAGAILIPPPGVSV